MKTNLLVLALVAVFAAPATAQNITVKALAEETGLTERQVRMVVGPRSGYPEYRVSFSRVQRQFKDALGQERYEDLMAGREIKLGGPTQARVVGVDAKPKKPSPGAL